jgi:hypothetical protein
MKIAMMSRARTIPIAGSPRTAYGEYTVFESAHLTTTTTTTSRGLVVVRAG